MTKRVDQHLRHGSALTAQTLEVVYSVMDLEVEPKVDLEVTLIEVGLEATLEVTQVGADLTGAELIEEIGVLNSHGLGAPQAHPRHMTSPLRSAKRSSKSSLSASECRSPQRGLSASTLSSAAARSTSSRLIHELMSRSALVNS